jgi:hypothetical protein
MIRVKYEHIVVIVNNALSGTCKITDDMHKRACRTGSVEPSLSKSDRFEQFRLLFFD